MLILPVKCNYIFVINNNIKMRKLNLITLTAICSFLLFQNSNAQVELPAILSSNMVMQRNSDVKLWGWADAKEKIKIEASWLDAVLELEADNEGSWAVVVKTTNSRAEQTIKITSKSSNIILQNILFGEVWLCSGQSNMWQPMRGYGGQPTFRPVMSIAKSHNPNLRLFTVEKVGSKTPLKDVDKFKPWQKATPESVSGFSAVAYYFGEQLQEILDVPVGLIHTSWGGSSVQAWMSNEVMSTFETVNLEDVDIKKRTNRIPTALFNSMINPLIPYAIKGALWYQGESNRTEPENYKKLFPAMVKDWRTRWNIGEFPFYYVQIAPYLYGDNNVFQKYENSAFIREAQLQCLDLIPNSGIAITLDLGEKNFIHPPKKKEVADRLLLNALNQTYGFKTVDGASPIYDSQEIKDNSIILTFKNAEKGLYTFDKLEGFVIAGNDKVFYPANATIHRGRLVSVSSEEVPNPVAVRYAWRNWVVGTLYDTNLLPASSFRTDDWDDAKKAEN